TSSTSSTASVASAPRVYRDVREREGNAEAMEAPSMSRHWEDAWKWTPGNRRGEHPTFRRPLLASGAPSGIFAHPMRRSATLTLLSSALLSLAGCKTPCRQLSEELCNCVQQFQRTDCVRLAAERERSVEPTDDDQTFCESKLDSCKLQKVEDESQPLS